MAGKMEWLSKNRAPGVEDARVVKKDKTVCTLLISFNRKKYKLVCCRASLFLTDWKDRNDIKEIRFYTLFEDHAST